MFIVQSQPLGFCSSSRAVASAEAQLRKKIDNDIRALARKVQDNRFATAAPGAGDQGDFIGKR